MSKTVKAQKNHAHLEELRFPEKVFVRRCKSAGIKTAELACTVGHIKTKLLDLGIVELKDMNSFIMEIKDDARRNGDRFVSDLFDLNQTRMRESMFSFIISALYRRENLLTPETWNLNFHVNIERLTRALEEEFHGYPGSCFREFMRI